MDIKSKSWFHLKNNLFCVSIKKAGGKTTNCSYKNLDAGKIMAKEVHFLLSCFTLHGDLLELCYQRTAVLYLSWGVLTVFHVWRRALKQRNSTWDCSWGWGHRLSTEGRPRETLHIWNVFSKRLWRHTKNRDSFTRGVRGTALPAASRAMDAQTLCWGLLLCWSTSHPRSWAQLSQWGRL